MAKGLRCAVFAYFLASSESYCSDRPNKKCLDLNIVRNYEVNVELNKISNKKINTKKF